jgi:hypothetical protein
MRLLARRRIPPAQVSFDANPDDAPAGASGAGLQAAEAGRKRRLEGAVLRTPLHQPVNSSEGTVVVNYLLPPPVEGGSAAAAVAAADSSQVLRPVRDYHMSVERVDALLGDEHYALFWDDDAAACYLAPIRARAALTSLKMHGTGAAMGAADAVAAAADAGPVRVLRRQPTEEEKALLQRARSGASIAAAAPAARPSLPRGTGAAAAPPSLYDRRRAAAPPEDFEPRHDEAELSD